MIFSEALLGCALGGNLQNNNSFSSIEIVFVVFEKKFLGEIFFLRGQVHLKNQRRHNDWKSHWKKALRIQITYGCSTGINSNYNYFME